MTPTDVVNLALSECGAEPIGSITGGGRVADAALRLYDATLREVFAAVPWRSATIGQELVLIGDSTGTLNSNTYVPPPWLYMYQWPIDCARALFVPEVVPPNDMSSVPFIVASAPLPNDLNSDWALIEGHDPESTRVILTNKASAWLYYVGIKPYPDAWEPLLLNAIVRALAAKLTLPAADPKIAVALRRDNIQLAEAAIAKAHEVSANQGWIPVMLAEPDWMAARRANGCAEWQTKM